MYLAGIAEWIKAQALSNRKRVCDSFGVSGVRIPLPAPSKTIKLGIGWDYFSSNFFKGPILNSLSPFYLNRFIVPMNYFPYQTKSSNTNTYADSKYDFSLKGCLTQR